MSAYLSPVRFKALLAAIAAAGMLMGRYCCYAQAPPPQSDKGKDAEAGSARGANSSDQEKPHIEFNLSSTVPQVRAAHHHDFQFADITVAGTTKTVVPADLLTPAEYIALHQVLMTGTQLVKLGAGGNAIGGHFRIDRALSEALSDLGNMISQSETTGGANSDSLAASERPRKRSTVAAPELSEEELIDVNDTSRVISGALVIIGNKKPRK